MRETGQGRQQEGVTVVPGEAAQGCIEQQCGRWCMYETYAKTSLQLHKRVGTHCDVPSPYRRPTHMQPLTGVKDKDGSKACHFPVTTTHTPT